MAAPPDHRPYYEPGIAAGILGRLLLGEDGADAIATVPAEGNEWYIYTQSNGPLATFVATIGILLAAGTALNLCRPAPAPKTVDSRPQLCAGIILLLFFWVSAFISLRAGLNGYAQGAGAAAEAGAAVSRVQEDLEVMNATAASLEFGLTSLTDTCQELDELVRRSFGGQQVEAIHMLQNGAAGELLAYRGIVARLQPGMHILAKLLNEVATRMALWPTLLLYCFLAPVKLTAVLIIAFLALNFARGVNSDLAASIDSVGMGRLAGAFAAAVVLSSCYSAAALLGLAQKAGCFCRDPDVSSLDLAGSTAVIMGAEQFVMNVGNFYIHGTGQNPLVTELVEAKARSDSLSVTFGENAKVLDTMSLLCDAVKKDSLNSTVVALNHLAFKDLTLIGKPAMYDLYHQAVHVGFCGSPLEATGLLIVCQLLVGLCCLPLLAALARPFVGHGALRMDTFVATKGRTVEHMGGGESLLEATMNRGRIMPVRDDSRGFEKARLLGTGSISDGSSFGDVFAKPGRHGTIADELEAQRHLAPEVPKDFTKSGSFHRDADEVDGGRHPSDESAWDYARTYGSSMLGGLRAPSFYVGNQAVYASTETGTAALDGMSSQSGAQQHGASPQFGAPPLSPSFRSDSRSHSPGPSATLSRSPTGREEATGEDLLQFVPKKREEGVAGPDRKTKFDEHMQEPANLRPSPSWWQTRAA